MVGGDGAPGWRVCMELIPGCLVQLLLDHQDAIAPEHNDPIHELLDDLGEVPTIESLIGEVLTYLPGSSEGGPWQSSAVIVTSSASALFRLCIHTGEESRSESLPVRNSNRVEEIVLNVYSHNHVIRNCKSCKRNGQSILRIVVL